MTGTLDDTYKTNKPCLNVRALSDNVLDSIAPNKDKLFLFAKADGLVPSDCGLSRGDLLDRIDNRKCHP